MTGWERIPEDVWEGQSGHVDRYRWAGRNIRSGETVLDIACGIGYAASVLKDVDCTYHGIDLPGVPSRTFSEFGTFHEADVDTWEPDFDFDVAVCFETLEHVGDLSHTLEIVKRAKRLVCVSVPTIPTVHMNPWHVRDFTEEDIPALFEGWSVDEVFYQHGELSHVWAFSRSE